MTLFSTFFNLGDSFVTSTLSQAGVIFSDFSSLITLVVVVFIGITAVVILIRAFHK